MEADFRLALHKAVVGDCVGEIRAHVLADVAKIKRLENAEMLGVEQHQYRHHLAVQQTAGMVRRRLPGTSTMCFFNSGAKYLQNSSRIQKISIKFALVIGVGFDITF